jgi:hypothetical protein
MQIWEEGYVYNSISFEVMHTQMIFILEGAPLRRPDGQLDRDRILSYLETVCGSVEFFRLRLQRGVLGLTPPAWVPDERFDIARHVSFSDQVAGVTSPELWALSGLTDGVMPIDHPLWRVRVTELDNGDVALGSIFHHASLDGLGAMKMLATMTQKSTENPDSGVRDPFAEVRAARGVELPLLAARAWLRGQSGFAGGWRDYWSKPFHRRVRRVGARLLRPSRDRALRSSNARERQIPARHSAFRTLDGQRVAQRAGELGGTVSDLLVASVIGAYDGVETEVSMRFPVSQRSVGKEKARNQVRDMELRGNTRDGLRTRMSSLRAQIAQRDSTSAFTFGAGGKQIGYATVIPWVSRPRYFSGARVTAVVPFPASLGTDELSAGAILYDGMMTVTVTMQARSDVDAVADRVERSMSEIGQED